MLPVRSAKPHGRACSSSSIVPRFPGFCLMLLFLASFWPLRKLSNLSTTIKRHLYVVITTHSSWMAKDPRGGHTKDQTSTLEFLLLSKDRARNIGVAPFHDEHRKQICITVKSDNVDLEVDKRLYIPPSITCLQDYTANLSHLLQLENGIIMGDFNAQPGSPRREQFADE